MGSVHSHGKSAFRRALAWLRSTTRRHGRNELITWRPRTGGAPGPLFSARWAGHTDSRLRLGILVAFAAQAVGYAGLGNSDVLWLACLCIALAHSGDSTAWVFSTTLLQLNTEVEMRGRVFATDLGFSSITIALGTYLAGLFLDRGVSAHAVAGATGLLMLIPTVAWGCAMKFLKPRPCLAAA